MNSQSREAILFLTTGNLMAKEEVGKKPPASVLRPISDETTWLQPKIKSRPNTQRTMLPVRSPRRAAGKVDEDGIKFASLSPDSKLVKLAKELHLSRQPKAIQPEATQQPEPRDENEVLLEAAAPLYSSGLGESVGPPNLREMIRPPPPPPSSPPVWSDVKRNWKDAMNQTSTKQSIPLLGTTYLQPQLKPKVAHVERQLKKEEEERALEEQRALSPPRANLRRGSVFISGNSNFGNPEGLMRASAASAALAAIPSTIRVTINE